MTDTVPARHRTSDQPRRDDGYFGPGSISWRVSADPSSRLGGVAGVLLQSLHPGMMRLFSNVSSVRRDPDARFARTLSYLETVTFGDTAHADAAAKVVRKIHAQLSWTDPDTGEQLHAATPSWQQWTHNTVVWGQLRAADAFGPELSTADQDRFVVEQHVSARLLGMDTALLPSTRTELDAYLEAEKSTKALGLAASEYAKNLRKPSLRGNPVAVWAGITIQDGILSLLPGWALQLWGIEGRPMNLRLAAVTTRRFLQAARKKDRYDAALVRMTGAVVDHPYVRVRSPSTVPGAPSAAA